MQDMNWDDLRYLIALYRQGSFAAASRELGQDETTIARRIRRLETSLSAHLLLRDNTGRQRLTELGQKLVARALRMETETRQMTEILGEDRDMITGTVRLTAVPVVTDRVLTQAFVGFQNIHPAITIELIPESRNLSLTTREADLALRLGPPKTGGSDILAQRIGWLEFGLYQSAAKPHQTDAQSRWIMYEPSHAHLEQASWMLGRPDHKSASGLKVADLNTAIEAVANGLGQSLLPIAACKTDVRLRRIRATGSQSLPKRPVWLLSHKHQSHLHAIQAVKHWLSQLDWGGVSPPPDKANHS